tara:strand:- start:28 stop:483 length:456 start_codon:yes stop_codon:yes gene_type:complete
MTIAEDLRQSVKALVCHEMDIVHEGDWFKDFVKGIVDESMMESRWTEVLQESEWFSDLVESIVDDRLKEIQDSEKDSDDLNNSEDKYFLVRWGEGYSTNRPVVYEMKEFLDDDFWNLPSDFLDDLKSSLPSDKLKFTDLSGDVHFERIGSL